MEKNNQNNKTEDGWLLRPITGPTDLSKATTLGSTEDELLTALYYDHSKWLEEVKIVCERAGKPLEQYLRKALGLAIEAGRVRDCNNNTALRLRGPERTGQDILLFFVKKCPHARDALLRGELPTYPWRISQSIGQEKKLTETESDIAPTKRQRIWTWVKGFIKEAYRITIKSFFDSIMNK